MKGPPQVHRRSVRGQWKQARYGRAGQGWHGLLASHGSAKGCARAPGGTVPPPPKADTPIPAGFSRLPADPVGHARARPSGPSVIFQAWRGTVGHRDPGASGSVNRLLRPGSVRHMSVTTAMQGLTAAHHDTQRDNNKAAREPGYAQAKGRFRRWWQVLGSNQRRLSRRFYRPLAQVDPYIA